MRKRKIVHIVENMPVGGLEKTVYMIMRGIDKSAFDVELWCLADTGFLAEKLRQEGYSVRVLGLKSYHNIKNVVKLASLIRAEKPDIIHTHGYFAGIFGRLGALLSLRKIKTVHHYQTIFAEFYTRANAFLERFFNSITSKVICVSEFVAKSYYTKKLLKPTKTTVIYNCADMSKYKCHSILEDVKIRIVIVASLREVKGHKYLIEAIDMLHKEFNNFEVNIIGSGPIENELRNMVESTGLNNIVLFRGGLDNVPEELGSMDIFVLSSIREGLPLSLVEAMASGLACVATNVGGVYELIEDRVTGLLVKSEDSEAIYKAIKHLIENPELARKMGKSARTKVEKTFDCRVMITKIEGLYEELMQKSL